MKHGKFILITVAMILAGCVSSAEQLQTKMAEKGVAPLSGAEVQALYSDATEYFESSKFKYVGYYATDGKLNGKAWGSWGEEFDQGSWSVNDQGYLCEEWGGQWARGPVCYEVYPGETDDEYVTVVVSGKKSSSTPSGIYHLTITQGNLTGL